SIVARVSASRLFLLNICRGFALLAVAGCSPAAQTAPEPATRDPNAATVIAEIALERGDCRAASATYATAPQPGDPPVAPVAHACERSPAAWDATKRWRALAPNDKDAAAVFATVALKLYRIPEARAAIVTVLKADETTAGEKGAAPKGPVKKSAPQPKASAK